jgi:hypothetical protein
MWKKKEFDLQKGSFREYGEKIRREGYVVGEKGGRRENLKPRMTPHY